METHWLFLHRTKTAAQRELEEMRQTTRFLTVELFIFSRETELLGPRVLTSRFEFIHSCFSRTFNFC